MNLRQSLDPPDFPTATAETDETHESYVVSNASFLRAVFRDAPPDTRPVIVSFPGRPSDARASSWSGEAWTDADFVGQASTNNYFSLATYRPGDSGRFRRRKANFAALHAVMLDDVGTKVPRERLTLPPSWLIETSPGNYQAGYLLAQPIKDAANADRLMKAVIAAGLCDPGSSGPTARLARLPEGVNGKHSPHFGCRLHEWRPDLHYSVETLAEELHLEVAQADRPRRPPTEGEHPRPADGDPVWTPRPEVNAVLVALRDRLLYKGPLGDGKHEITCPWSSQHTDGIDTGSAYCEPDDNWPIGGFKCHHGHCVNRHIRDLLACLGVDAGAARMRPTIRVIDGEIHRVVEAAERALAASGRHYQRGGLITTVITDPGTRETRIQEISQQALVRECSASAAWEKFDRRSMCWVRTDPPSRHIGVLYEVTRYSHLPVLLGLARQPYLRSDLTLMTEGGYDSSTRMFGVFDSRLFSIPEHPTIEDARRALAELRALLDEFSFADASDLAAALAAILTAVVRPSLSTAPMFHVRAHMVGSGKSYLCALITAFATPQRGTPTTFPSDDEETRKLLLAELIRGPATIEFDNLTGDLVAHKSLCTALTSEFMTGRILGTSKTASVSTRTLFLSSGNNVGPVQDMARRVITINLSPQVEVPAARSFQRPNLVNDVLRERGRFVSAALTIVRAWVVAGRPRAECKSFASYGDWSDICRQPLLWLGCDDPTASVFQAIAEDPDRETLGRLLCAWHRAFANSPAMVRDAVSRASEFSRDSELREVLHDIADERGEINRRRLGRWINRRAGRIVDGLKFARADGTRSAEAWKVESVSPVSEVSRQSLPKTVSHPAGARSYRDASRGE